LAIDEHIDPNFQLKRAQAAAQGKAASKEKTERPEGVEAPDTFEDLLGPDGRAIKRAEEERAAKRHKFPREPEKPRGGGGAAKPHKFPAEPEKDLLLFFAEHAPSLEDWQRDILLIVREEMQYFVPQMQTKVLNEGWAPLTHARIMREMDPPDADYAAFAQMHSGVLAASRTHMNPYLLGYRILEDIERRWDNPTEEE